ncbi:MAG: ParB/RepB/Spo0J family partition protein [Bacillota bacterium]
MSKNRLGKGLGALINESSEEKGSPERVIEIYVENIEPNPYQPRKNFEQKSLEELGQSIKENGMIQPITVREVKPEQYQLVSGERRWRACRIVGQKKVMAIVKDYTDQQLMEIALVENLQREDLNPIEEAQAYQQMFDEFNLTQAEVAKKVGKSRSTVANVVRLLNLAPKVQIYVSRGTLSMGHARALLPLKNSEKQIEAAEYIIKNELSVRETEEYVNKLVDNKNKKENEKEDQKKEKLDEKWKDAKEVLSKVLGTGVKIKKRRKKKVVTFTLDNFAEMEKILSKLR